MFVYDTGRVRLCSRNKLPSLGFVAVRILELKVYTFCQKLVYITTYEILMNEKKPFRRTLAVHFIIFTVAHSRCRTRGLTMAVSHLFNHAGWF